MGKIIAIACIDNKRGLGKDSKLLFDMPLDKRFFRIITTNNMVIMGRRTFDSMNRRPLSDRVNVVLTHDAAGLPKLNNLVWLCEETPGIVEWIKHWVTDDKMDLYIIGGGSVYTQLLPYCDYLYLAEVDATMEADTFFPEWYVSPETVFYPIYQIYRGQMWDRRHTRFFNVNVSVYGRDLNEKLPLEYQHELNACF